MNILAAAELLNVYASRCRRHERRRRPETDASRRDRWLLAVLCGHVDAVALALRPFDAPPAERMVHCASWEASP